MVTRVYRGRKARLFLKEWREHKGVSPEEMAGRLDIDRVSVYRWEREQNRMTPPKQAAYAESLGIEPEQLWRPPERPSIDAILTNAPDDLRQKLAEMAALMLKTGTNG